MDSDTTEREWVKRAAVPADENCLASMWLKSFAKSETVRKSGYPDAGVVGSHDEIRYWKAHQPIVTALLRTVRVEVICDPERFTYADGPAVIWAWAARDDRRVYWCGIKRSAAKAGLAPDLLRDLLGGLVDRPIATPFEICDLAGLATLDVKPGWLSSLRSLSTWMQNKDATYAAVGAHVLDLRRREWKGAA